MVIFECYRYPFGGFTKKTKVCLAYLVYQLCHFAIYFHTGSFSILSVAVIDYKNEIHNLISNYAKIQRKTFSTSLDLGRNT